MKRLTTIHNGHPVMAQGYEEKFTESSLFFMLLNKLAAYEDTNLTPADINDLRNELCLKCGKYKDAHLGTCDGCRWRKKQGEI